MMRRGSRSLIGALLAPFILLVLSFGTGTALSAADTRVAGEYEVKAAFLYSFSKFVQWPDRAFSSSEAPFVIGVLGEDPFGPLLEGLADKRLQGRKVEVWRLGSLRNAPACHILFVSDSEAHNLAAVIQSLQSSPTLLVSDISGFARRGGMINFLMEKNKVLFEINAEAAKRGGLGISAQLLKLARAVY